VSQEFVARNGLIALADTSISGSLTVSGSVTANQGFTGSLFGTASWAVNASSSLNTQDILIYVKNVTGQQIDKGKVVRISGATGDNALINLADWTDDASSANTLGLTNTNIPDQAFGYVMTEGKLIGIDTSLYTAGQLLFLASSGSITGSAPLAPLHAVRLGQVLRVQGVNGSIYVRIDNGYELDELHDVRITSPVTGQALVRSGSIWVNGNPVSSSYALSASFLIGGGGGGGGLTVNVNAIDNQTVNPSSGNGDRYVYSCTGVNTFILPNPAGNKNIYTFKLLNGSNTIYGSNFPLIDDGTIVYMSTPNTAINIISNNTIYTIF
jgi:hypothetical protein